MDENYRVNLDVFNGPMDLLLYLIRRDEVDIHDIPIAHITKQYIQYVEVIKQLDPNIAGDFLVMAATLMEIKTRILLPTVSEIDDDDEFGVIDPRGELVRQLLEYKRFKDAAGDLNAAAALQAMQHPRHPVAFKADDDTLDLEDVQVWDLMQAFSSVLAEIGKGPAIHEVIYDDTPIELHELDLLDRLEREGSLKFSQVFASAAGHGQILGLFLALLELIRQQKIKAVQDGNFGEINIDLNPNPPSLEELTELGQPNEPAAEGEYQPEPADEHREEAE
jgi:segregation and condensation protein A